MLAVKDVDVRPADADPLHAQHEAVDHERAQAGDGVLLAVPGLGPVALVEVMHARDKQPRGCLELVGREPAAELRIAIEDADVQPV